MDAKTKIKYGLKVITEAVSLFENEAMNCRNNNIIEYSLRADNYISNFRDQHYVLSYTEEHDFEDANRRYLKALDRFQKTCTCKFK